MEVTCPHCGNKFFVKSAKHDDLGCHTTCPVCKGSFDVDYLEKVNEEEIPLLYSSDDVADIKNKCVGHLRGYFSDRTYWHTWFPHQNQFRGEDFKDDLEFLMTSLRKSILENFHNLSTFCRGYDTLSDDNMCYGFKYESEIYKYYIRFLPTMGEYNVYVYCYKK